MDVDVKKIYEKVVQLLNESNFSKQKLSKITKDELKPILKMVYIEFGTLGSIVNSQKQVWKKAAREVIEDDKKDDNEQYKKEIIEDGNNVDDTKADLLSREDYDDLIQPEFPSEYNDLIHSKKIENLAKQLENERIEELSYRNIYNSKVEDLFKKIEEVKDKNDEKEKLELEIKEKKKRIKKTN